MTVAIVPRDRRHARLRDLVATFEVASQAELVDLLADHGITATQATVSRDLEELGIAKTRGADGRSAYTLPELPALAQTLRQFATAVDASGNLAVVRTPPGTAAAVAIAIDAGDVPDVLATLQGDDTVLVVAREPATGRDVAERLRALAHARPVHHTRPATDTEATPSVTIVEAGE